MIPEIPSQSHILEILYFIPFSFLMFSFEDWTHYLLYTPSLPRHCELARALSRARVPEQCGKGTPGTAELFSQVQASFLRVPRYHSHLS